MLKKGIQEGKNIGIILKEAEKIWVQNNFNLSSQSNLTHNFKYPKEFVIFHYKMNLFNNLLKWEIEKVFDLIEFLSKKYKYVLFSSEINNDLISNYFSKKYNQFENRNDSIIIDDFTYIDLI